MVHNLKMHATTRQMIDPQLLPVLELFPHFALSGETLGAVREMFAAAPDTPIPEGLERAQMFVAGPTGSPDVRVLVYRPDGGEEEARPAVLHIHGGGYVIGTPEMNDPSNRVLAITLGCVVVSVDYRLAPETPFPGPLEDCYAALLWLWRTAEALGVDRERIAVVGESAGGGLAAALALLARDRGEVKLAFQQLVAPMLDDRTMPGDAANVYVGEFVWQPANNLFGWTSMLGGETGGVGVSPYAAAARATSLLDLPATYISVGALDLFLEENIEYARRLLRAGIPVELHVIPGAFHGFEGGWMIGAPPAVKATETARAALRRALFPL
jgi:acetyl esterase/lipase